MKAVIMAGGMGTRLKPLTCNLPKPMVPIFTKPVMEYTINLLKQYDITEIAVTLQYLPKEIENYFGNGSQWGVNLHYFEETKPLGTAGSVKNCSDFLDESFIVISGDGITDFNLQEAIDFHNQKKALATIVLTPVEEPLEYGVVITDAERRIVRFLEKPNWSQVFSDLVNTGIYILEPAALNICPEGQFFDFSKDLFPQILAQKLPFYGYSLKGYWSDIGNIHQYRQTQFDILAGQTKIPIAASETAPGVWLQEGVKIGQGVKLQGPLFIGRNTIIESGASIGEYSVIGPNNVIRENATTKRTISWNNSYLGSGAELRGCIIGAKVRVGEKTRIYEGAAIGDCCNLARSSTVNPDIKLWPYKETDEGVKVTQSLIWGQRQKSNIFGLNGISGLLGVELNPFNVAKIAGAYASTLPSMATVVLGRTSHKYTSILADSIKSSLLASGINVIDAGMVSLPILRYIVKSNGGNGGFYVGHFESEKGTIVLLDKNGHNIPAGLERKIENCLAVEEFPCITIKETGELNQDHNGLQEYEQ
ncbi:MAG: sugar phosphate nucleotidyltransferase, partial [Bacillota bacterium]|nr:sugar phosphate nucleotidyltransferase [Bacillota bacterium]